MPSAPAGGARASPPRRRPASASPARARRSPRRLSAPARLGGSLNPMYRRALSASPGVRRWSPGRARRPAARRSPPKNARRFTPWRLATGLTGLLALQAAMRGHKAPVPVPWKGGTAVAIYPLGASAPPYNLGPVHTIGRKHQLNKYPVVERVRLRRPLTCGRKACLGGQPNSRLFEPKRVNVSIHGTKVPRRFGNRAAVTLPVPVISASDVLRFEAQGYQLPKKVLQQAHAGLPILANAKPSKRALELLANKDPRLLPALLEASKPLPSRFNVPVSNRLALPAPVQRKLAALEARTRAAAISGTAKALATPWVVAAKARNVTGRAAAAVGRGASAVARRARYAASLPGRGHRALWRTLTAQQRKLPN